MTVSECKRRMTQKEFVNWQAYYSIEPFGVLQEKLGFAYLLCLIANMFRKETATPFKAEDFFPELGDGKKKVDWYSPENQVLLARMWCESHGGKVLNGENSRPS